MSEKTVFQFDYPEMSEVCNQTKDVFLNTMIKENIITDSQFREMRKYSVIASKKNMLGNLWSKLWGKNQKTETKLIVVKVMSNDPEDEAQL